MFLFRLALALGWHDPDQLAEHLSTDQLDEWMRYYQIEPWQTRHEAALLAGVFDQRITEMLCVLTKTKYTPDMHPKAEDYVMGYRPPSAESKQTPADMARKLGWTG